MANFFTTTAAVLTTGAFLLGTTGCENLPGTPGQQGAAMGGVGGAVAGAALGGHHRLLGALVGGAVGAGGGYLIGANKDRITGHDTEGAQRAMQRAQTTPATPEQARVAPTADLNGDGFVTMDEVVAMKQAGLPDEVILQKLRATGQVFELGPDQQQFLLNNGVSRYVVDQMPEINREQRDQLLNHPLPPTGYQQYPQTTAPPPPVISRP